MTLPENALARARQAAAEKRSRGGYAGQGADTLDATILGGRVPAELLSEWAVIEIEPDLVYSTRRAGAPITALKRLLLRLLRQHLVELEARQTRFNLGLLAAVQHLEERVEHLESSAAEAEAEPEPE